MGIPQIIYIVIVALALGLSLAKHGEVEMKRENFWTTFIASSIQLAILYWGGFFS